MTYSYVSLCSFADRDMFMRSRGGGIGHRANPNEARPAASATTAPGLADEAEELGPEDVVPEGGLGPGAPGPEDDDGGEAPLEGDLDELDAEAQEYSYEDPDELLNDDGDDGDDTGEAADAGKDELGPEDGEGEEEDDIFSIEGYAPY